MTMWIDHIDQIVYINLDRRLDRNASILKEMKRMKIPANKFQRFSAVENSRGAIGCTFSHIKVLQMAIEKKWKNVLILEDDFVFIDSPDIIESHVSHFFEKVASKIHDWAVINFSRGAGQSMRPVDTNSFLAFNEANQHTIDTGDKIVWKADAISSTSGYLVNKPFYETLLKNFKEGLGGLLKTYDKPKYALDMYWMPLQTATPGWFIFNPSLGYQYESYSDVEQQVVDYVGYDKSIKFEQKGLLNIKIMGGLGNQLFQIAAGCGIAWLNDMEPVFEKIYESPSVFKPRPVYWDSLLKNVPLKKTHEMSKIQFIPVKYPNNKYSPIRLSHNKNYTMEGYFQNPRFFELYRDRILEMFRLPDNQMDVLKSVMTELVNDVDARVVMVHVRRGDYLKLQDFHITQTMDYYNNARDKVESLVGQYSTLLKYNVDNLVYVIFSDDIEWCKKEFDQWSQRCVFVNEEIHKRIQMNPELKGVPLDVCELMLMTLSTHAIIANSSFSWWGAYLNQTQHKLIIAPSKWLTNEAQNTDMLNIIDNTMIVI
jgi:glycosyl transferase family 25